MSLIDAALSWGLRQLLERRGINPEASDDTLAPIPLSYEPLTPRSEIPARGSIEERIRDFRLRGPDPSWRINRDAHETIERRLAADGQPHDVKTVKAWTAQMYEHWAE